MKVCEFILGFWSRSQLWSPGPWGRGHTLFPDPGAECGPLAREDCGRRVKGRIPLIFSLYELTVGSNSHRSVYFEVADKTFTRRLVQFSRNYKDVHDGVTNTGSSLCPYPWPPHAPDPQGGGPDAGGWQVWAPSGKGTDLLSSSHLLSGASDFSLFPGKSETGFLMQCLGFSQAKLICSSDSTLLCSLVSLPKVIDSHQLAARCSGRLHSDGGGGGRLAPPLLPEEETLAQSGSWQTPGGVLHSRPQTSASCIDTGVLSSDPLCRSVPGLSL